MSRGWEAHGETPSRMIARRSGPMRSIRNRPAARALCSGRKTESRLRLRRSTASVRLRASRRRLRAAHAMVAGGQLPDIVRVPMGGDDEFADGRSVAQTEIETLRADRRNDVRGFPDKRHPPGAETGGSLDH